MSLLSPSPIPRKCLLDLDGVLVDFVSGVFALRGLDINGSQDGIRWDFIEDHEWGLMGRSFFAGLRPTPFAFEIINAVETAFGSDNVCILTSPVKTPGCYEGKLDWIRRYLPRFERRILVGAAKEFCANPNSVLVDDYDVNIDKFRRNGGTGILIPQPWNERRGTSLEVALSEIALFGTGRASLVPDEPLCSRCNDNGLVQPAPGVRGLVPCPQCTYR
jgi:hypothetical protein